MKKNLLICLFTCLVPCLKAQEADSLGVTGTHASERMSCVGKFICRHFDTSLDSLLFANYWFGGGDIELSSCQFDSILLCLDQQTFDTLPADSGLVPCIVSFYGTPYEKSFGCATVYVDENRRVVGFYDYYNFDRKRWGDRPLKYEFYVRLVSLLSPPSAAPFKIHYNNPLLDY